MPKGMLYVKAMWLSKEECKHLVPSNDTAMNHMIMNITIQYKNDVGHRESCQL